MKVSEQTQGQRHGQDRKRPRSESQGWADMCVRTVNKRESDQGGMERKGETKIYSDKTCSSRFKGQTRIRSTEARGEKGTDIRDTVKWIESF